MATKTFNVQGMHCASCAATIEKTLKKSEGVSSAEVNYGTETVKLTYDEHHTDPAQLSKHIEPLGYSIQTEPTAESMGMSADEHAAHLGLTQSRDQKIAELTRMRRLLFSILPLAAFSILLMGWDAAETTEIVAPMSETLREFFHHLLPIFATYALVVVGKPYLLGFYRFLRHGKANMDSLIGIGTSAAFLYSFTVSAFEETLRPFLDVEHTYYDVTIVVIAFITLGKYLESRSKLKTGDAIQALLSLQTKTALVIRDGHEMEISIEDVVVNDLIVIKPASRIPVDGVITDGSSFIDESTVTGEPIPVEKSVGATVVAGTMNTSGAFTFRATKVGADTLLSHIIRMVQDAQGSKAPIQGLADRISAVFVPIVIVLAFLSLVAWLLFGTGPLGFAQALSYGLVCFVSILVIACPCALGLATPTAIIVGVGKGASEGILIKDAATLEMLHKATVIMVDKTGTITKGKPELVSITPHTGMTDEEIIRILASLEAKSEHPIAHAITTYTNKRNITTTKVSAFEAIKGKGVTGRVDGITYLAGNARLMTEHGIAFDAVAVEEETRTGRTPLFLATEDKLLAVVMVADTLKPGAREAVRDLHTLGMTVVMMTGDNANTATAIARDVGIDKTFAEVLPQDKQRHIQELQAEGEIVAMAGDGVNDAPALAQADVGIAMATGTDVAIESAGITLLGGDISKLAKAVRLSKLTMNGIRQNLFWAFIYNLIGIPLASGILFPFFGWLLSPVFAGMAMALSSVSVVMNSLRLKTKKL
jgi:Cu+-exporting ATPase